MASVLLPLFLLVAGCSSVPPTATPTATTDPQIIQGKELFSRHCASCHAVAPDTVIVGPSLAGIATQAAERMEGYNAEEYISLSITRPSAYLVRGFEDQMPSTFGKDLTGEELDALVAYLLTLE